MDGSMDSHYQQEAFKAAAKERGFIYPETNNYDNLKRISNCLKVKDLKKFAAISGVNIHKKMKKHNLIDAKWYAMEERPGMFDCMHLCMFANIAMIRFLKNEGVTFVMGGEKWFRVVRGEDEARKLINEPYYDFYKTN